MKTQFRCGVVMMLAGHGLATFAQTKAPAKVLAGRCSRAVVEGDVRQGESFERVFRPGMMFKLEAIASGWIVRVFPAGEARAPHDYAELATPPYQSVTPLAVSTDFSFRAQDAVGWNPRQFHYAGSAGDFAQMQRLYDPAMRGDAAASAALASLAAKQPEAQFTILDARLVPGANDQVGMAAAVASHFATTPHEVDQSGGKEALGKVTGLRFRVTFDLPEGLRAVPGVTITDRNCEIHPTMRLSHAS